MACLLDGHLPIQQARSRGGGASCFPWRAPSLGKNARPSPLHPHSPAFQAPLQRSRGWQVHRYPTLACPLPSPHTLHHEKGQHLVCPHVQNRLLTAHSLNLSEPQLPHRKPCPSGASAARSHRGASCVLAAGTATARRGLGSSCSPSQRLATCLVLQKRTRRHGGGPWCAQGGR